MWKDYRFDILILAGGIAASLLVGYATGAYTSILSVFLGSYLAWYMISVHRLRRALENPIQESAGWAVGPFRAVFEKLYRLKARSLKRKRRLSRFIERFREAAASLPDAAIALDEDGRIEWCNPATADLLGIRWPADAGRPLCEVVPDPLLEAWLLEDSGQSVEFHPPCNEALTVTAIIKPFGKRRERLLIARDITEIYKINRVQRDFVANVSHELVTPITVIGGFLEGLAEEPMPESLIVPMSHIRNQTTRMRELVEDLLVLSRLELEERSQELVEVDMASLVDTIVIEARELCHESRHQFHVSVDTGINIRGSLSEIRSTINNLVVNAVRHTPPLTDVRISWGCEGSGACLEVRDNGPGIAQRHIPRLTEPFYRVDSARSRHTGGTGLGLAIVKRILERHGAELNITCPPRQGSAFRCHFPADALIASAVCRTSEIPPRYDDVHPSR